MSDAIEIFLTKQGLEDLARENNYDCDKMMAEAIAKCGSAEGEAFELAKKLFKLTVELHETISKWVELHREEEED